MSDSCLFCKIAAGEIPCNKIFENDLVLAFRDIAPQAPEHILIIPKVHIPTLNDALSHGDSLAAIQLAAIQIAKDLGVSEQGYRTVFNCNRDGGQEVFHIHLHLLAGRKLSWPPG